MTRCYTTSWVLTPEEPSANAGESRQEESER
jgi:hypothetical protein